MGQSRSASKGYKNLLVALKNLNTSDLSTPEKNDIIVQLRNTLRVVQSPWQQLQALIWEDSGHAAALKIAHDTKLFQLWLSRGDGPLSMKQISALISHVDSQLIDRVVRALAYKGTLENTTPDQYSLNDFSRALADPTFAACLDYWFDIQTPALSNLPSFLQATSYQFPNDPSNTAWNQATKDPAPFFAWLSERPDKLTVFAQVMQLYSASQTSWVDMYPTDIIAQSPLSEGPMVVDIGGGIGHDLNKFIDKHDPPAGSCYLQDLEDVIQSAIVDKQRVIAQAHDIFEPQPIKGARLYYLHNILHDWPDDECRVILKHLRQAMEPQVSRILIHELVRLEDGRGDRVSLGEFTVMSILGSPERSERQWRDLIASTGLEVVQIYSSPLSAQSILEVMATRLPSKL